MTDTRTIALAGATGDLGGRIVKALVKRGAIVRALIRTDISAKAQARIKALGAEPVPADPTNLDAMTRALTGADCVVSALNGVGDTILGRQGILLDAAVKAGVPRFIPSDYSEDFTKTTPGRNRNLDLRRTFMARVDASGVRATTVLNGAFMDMLGAEMPVIQPRIHRVIYWRSADQALDFTTKDDTAEYVAAVALDDEAPRILRIAGDTVTTRDIARIMTDLSGHPWRPLYVGGIGALSAMIAVTKLIAPQPGNPFPAWQGMQYMRDMFSGEGKLHSLDNARYGKTGWTSVRDVLSKIP